VSPNDLHYEGRKIIVHGFPIGIEPDEFKQRLESIEVQDIISKLRGDFEGQKLIIGVDRLDYIKGIPQKLKAFDRFLTENPKWIGKVALIQISVPTRQSVDAYQRLRDDVECLVGHINGKHGT
jgi:trehalose 6-phosphate synthase